MLELIPVIEFSPSTFQIKQHILPKESSFENPEGWLTYWKESLKDSNILDLTPVGSSWLVPISQIFDFNNTMKIYLSSVWKDIDINSLDEIGTIDGGYVLRYMAKDLIFPGCCGDLSNLSDWETLSQYQKSNWQEIWVGHPCISVKYCEGKLEISEPHEPGDLPLKTCCSLEPVLLTNAIELAKQQIATFHQNIQIVLMNFFPNNMVKQVAHILVYGH